MALTPFRWIALAIACCLVMAVAVTNTSEREESAFDQESHSLERTAQLYGDRVYVDASRLHRAELFDSTRATLPRSTSRDTLRVFYDKALPADLRAMVSALVSRTPNFVQTARHSGIDIIAVLDTVRVVHSVPMAIYGVTTTYRLPTRDDDRCTVLVRIPGVAQRHQVFAALRSQASADQLLGPCAYYHAFGMPGLGVKRWLDARGWILAADGSWTRSDPPVRYDRPSPYFTGASPALYEFATDGAFCANHDDANCERAVLRPRPASRTGQWGNFVDYAWRLGGGAYRQNALLGDREPQMLADMVRTLGHEKFGAFWTSNDSAPAAFRKATGESLGSWVSGWAVDQYGEVHGGPTIGSYAIIVSLLIVALSIFAALRMSARRQFA